MAVSAYFEGTPEASAGRDIAAINITPLVDVLLVLLIIFMVAAPVVTRSIDLDLPHPTPNETPRPQTIRLGIDASGELHWNDAVQPLSALEALMAVEAQRSTPGKEPLLQIDASGDADYGRVARVLAAARNAGLDRIVFVQR
jgi:biopolymer transport protein ExbD